MASAAPTPTIIGHVHFDSPTSRSGLCEMLAAKGRAEAVFRNKYVRIAGSGETAFLARIVEGPYFVPEEVGKDSAFAQTAILRGEQFRAMPEYYVLARIEILGELRDDAAFGTNTRPLPKSPVADLNPVQLSSLIGLSGDMLLGSLVGYPDVRVAINSKLKSVLPRNLGIFGTVGSGKTNTSQVLIEEASRAGYAVIVLDVEGEYIAMDQPTADRRLLPALVAAGRKPEGLADFRVYHPHGGEPNTRASVEFGVPFAEVPPWLVAEFADLTEAQEGPFLSAHHAVMSSGQPPGRKKRPKSQAIEFLQGDDAGDATLPQLIAELPNHAGQAAQGTMWALTRKLKGLERTRIFDASGALGAADLIAPGRVSVIDTSSLHNDAAKNLAIAWVLKTIYDAKLQREDLPPTLVVIEEAHTFISKETRDKMAATMDMLKLIARRGRKRWLALAFVSQQPSHIPEEIFELCNTRIIHSVKSDYNLNPLKRTSGDVVSELWEMLPSLGPGQALVSSPQFTHAILAAMRPCATRRRMIE